MSLAFDPGVTQRLAWEIQAGSLLHVHGRLPLTQAECRRCPIEPLTQRTDPDRYEQTPGKKTSKPFLRHVVSGSFIFSPVSNFAYNICCELHYGGCICKKDQDSITMFLSSTSIS